MNAPPAVRIDKWLWSVRIFKTRSLAASACRSGEVTIGGQAVKPSREVRINDIVTAKTGVIVRTIKVLGLIERRVGAPVAREYAQDLTLASEYAKRSKPVLEPMFFRPKGTGRPTKRDRRVMGRITKDL